MKIKCASHAFTRYRELYYNACVKNIPAKFVKYVFFYNFTRNSFNLSKVKI